jgi:hypothetical protein
MNMKRILRFPVLSLSVIAILALSWVPANPESDPNLNTETITTPVASAASTLDNQARALYTTLGLEEQGLSYPVFEKAYTGYLNLQASDKARSDASILSIADFSLSSKKKRLWIVDLDKGALLMNTWVSHGRGSGGDMATDFSNTVNSHQSSLGFYVTGEVYYGKHGRSLRLDGMDKGFNSRARERAIVVHGASYVSAQAIKSLNRLGLSHGCPAVPLELTDQIIDIVKDKTVLYVHAEEPDYRSVYLDTEAAGQHLLASTVSTGLQAAL